MKNIADVETQLKKALENWYPRQLKGLNANFYLYFRPSTKIYAGKLFITNGRTIHDLVMPERINKAATIEQNFNKIRLQGVLAQLPILSI